MSITFITEKSALIMLYEPEYGCAEICTKIEKEHIFVKHTFWLAQENRYYAKGEQDMDTVIAFKVGELQNGYYKLDKKIFGTDSNFFFASGIKIKSEYFVAYRNISILKKIDSIIKGDMYVDDGPVEVDNHISIEVYQALINTFPNTNELTKYTGARIARSLLNYFEGLGAFEQKYEEYLNLKEKMKVNVQGLALKELQLELFQNTYGMMEEMLENASSYSEHEWQLKVKDIVCVAFPKYVLAQREVVVGSVGEKKKKPDFLLIDAEGFVDVLEIKKPNEQRLVTKTMYRNNYVPDRDLSGAIVQIEKYIYCLRRNGENFEKQFQTKFKQNLPQGMFVRVVNPQGLLLMGRSEGLIDDQIFDLEIIKRQYKNVIDIMTYDDLLKRLENIIKQLEGECNVID